MARTKADQKLIDILQQQVRDLETQVGQARGLPGRSHTAYAQVRSSDTGLRTDVPLHTDHVVFKLGNGDEVTCRVEAGRLYVNSATGLVAVHPYAGNAVFVSVGSRT